MRKLFLGVLLLMTTLSYGKKLERLKEYKASNGVVYHVGDTVKLNKGSNYNGSFNYVTMGGWMVSSNPEANKLPSTNAGLLCTIKKIKKYNRKRMKSVVFTVGGGNITNYSIKIEEAIAACEVTPCKGKSDNVQTEKDDKYDKLRKIKELFDDGVLSKEEYEKEKKKILDS